MKIKTNILEEIVSREITRKLLVKVTKRRFNRTRYWNEYRRRMSRAELKFKKILVKYFKQQKLDVLSRGKSYTKDIYQGWSFDFDEWNRRLQLEGIEFIKTLVAQEGSEVLRLLRYIMPETTVAFDITNPFIDGWIQSRALDLAKGINETTTNAIRDQLSQAMNLGEGIPQIADRIESVFDEATGYRSQMIARTETIAASNYAAEEGYSQSGVVEGKEWLTAPGCCEACEDVNGEIVGLNEPFSSGDMFPPLHPNCLCCVLPVIKEE